MPQADCTAPLKSTSLGSRYSRPMPLNSARQVSSVSASTVATKSRRSSWARGDVDGDGACCVVGGLVGASPWRMTRGSKPKKRASSTRTTVPMPPPATSGPPKPRRSSMLSLCLPPKRTVHLQVEMHRRRCKRRGGELQAQRGRSLLQPVLHLRLVDLYLH